MMTRNLALSKYRSYQWLSSEKTTPCHILTYIGISQDNLNCDLIDKLIPGYPSIKLDRKNVLGYALEAGFLPALDEGQANMFTPLELLLYNTLGTTGY